MSYRQVSRQLISGRSCLVLDRGRIVEQGEVWQIFGDPQHEVSPAVATNLLGIAQALGGQVSLLHGGIERIQSRAQGRRFLGVATSQGPGALLARASSLADQVPGYLAPA
ncbi:NIL domain-containing protein [Pseudomonas umsongensis]|uniref:NIL domain-containing protein n=1 Tax=Pseudomonas umsongensis TaxID=198618 RepID=UPI00036B0801|nr:NIL domain-containing protein [Pseudomonas umsongensis]